MAEGGVLVRGHVQRVSLGHPARRQRLSSERRERRERRSSHLRATNTCLGMIGVSVVTCQRTGGAGHVTPAPYLAVADGVAQSKVLNLQDEDAVVELDEVSSLLLP